MADATECRGFECLTRLRSKLMNCLQHYDLDVRSPALPSIEYTFYYIIFISVLGLY